MAPTPHVDPRERLVALGNEVLDLMYKRYELRTANAEVFKMLVNRRNGEELDRDATVAVIEKLPVFLDDMQIGGELEHARSSYFLLRQTIDALETPRATVPDVERVWSSAEERDRALALEAWDDAGEITDRYGFIPKKLHDWLLSRNVSTSDYDDIISHTARNEQRVREFVNEHTVDGSYRAPWPFPHGRRR